MAWRRQIFLKLLLSMKHFVKSCRSESQVRPTKIRILCCIQLSSSSSSGSLDRQSFLTMWMRHAHNVRESEVPSVVHAETTYFVEKIVLFSCIKTKRLVNWAVFSDRANHIQSWLRKPSIPIVRIVLGWFKDPIFSVFFSSEAFRWTCVKGACCVQHSSQLLAWSG